MRLTAVLLLVMVVVVAVMSSVPSVEGKLCKHSSAAMAWKHSGGTFQKVRSSRNEWMEYDNKNGPGTRFVEQMREANQVVLFNEEREIRILLRDDLAGIANKGEDQFQQLYQGTWMKVVDCTEA